MKNNKNTTFLLCIGLLLLSFEIFSVKLLQAADKVNGSFYDNIWFYYKKWYVFIPILITVCAIIYALYLLIRR